MLWDGGAASPLHNHCITTVLSWGGRCWQNVQAPFRQTIAYG